MKKRLFSILTALCLCLSLMPTAAMAADDTSIPCTPADVNYGLGKAVENGTVSTERDQQLDMDQDGRFTS